MSAGGMSSGGSGTGGSGTEGTGLSPEDEALLAEYREHLKINELAAHFVEIYLDGDEPEDISLDGVVVTVNDGDSCAMDGITVTSASRFAVAQADFWATCPVEGMCVSPCPIDLELEDVVELSVWFGGDLYVIDSQEQVDTPLIAIESYSARPDGTDDFDKVIFSRGAVNN